MFTEPSTSQLAALERYVVETYLGIKNNPSDFEGKELTVCVLKAHS
jgi:hypothetical protein